MMTPVKAYFLAAVVVLTGIFASTSAFASPADITALYNSVSLVSNTYNCGGPVTCEAIFTVPSTTNKTFTLNDITITFEDKNNQTLAPTFTADFNIGTLQNVSYSYLWQNCTNSTLPNGSVQLSCSPVNVSYSRQEIVYHGKYLKQGTNYVRIWSNDKPTTLWVDWQMLINGIPGTSGQSVTFDTHITGWAVWGVGPGTSSQRDVMGPSSGTSTIWWIGNYAEPSAMQFTPVANYTLTTIQFHLSAGTTLPFNVSLYNSTNYTNGTALAVPDKRICNNQMVTFSSPGLGYYNATGFYCNVTRGQTYWVVFAAATNTSNFYRSTETDGTNVGKYCVNISAGTLDPNQCLPVNWKSFSAGGVSMVDIITYGVQNWTFTPAYQRQVVMAWNSTQSGSPSVVTNKSIAITVDNATFNSTALSDFGDVRVKMVNNSHNDTVWDYKLTWINGSAASITFKVSSDAGGNFNGNEQYFLVWGSNFGVTTSNSSLFTNFTGAPTNWTFGSITNYSEGGAPPSADDEPTGRQAILSGVQTSVIAGSYTAVYDRQLYIRIANGSQYNGRFDLFVQSANKRWAFNYDQNTTSNFPVFVNVTPVLYIWQMASMTNTSIIASVSAYINSTN